MSGTLATPPAAEVAAPPGGGNRTARAGGRSLFWVIAGAFLLAALLGTLAQGLVVVAVLGPLEARDLRARAELAVSRFATEFAALPDPADSAAVVQLLRRTRAESEVRGPLFYRGPGGRPLADRPDRAAQLAAALARPDGGLPADPGAPAGRSRGRIETLVARTLERDGAPAGEIRALRFSRPPRGTEPPSTSALLLSLPIALIASLVAALVVVRLLMRRLRALERLATRVAEGDLSARIDDARGDEIGRLADRLNRMAERLAAARAHLEVQESQRRQLFADITHELATPLTSIRGYTETLLDPAVPVSDDERTRYLRDMLEESRRLDRLIRDLFDLARMEAGATALALEPLDWVALNRNVAERFAPRCTAAGLSIRWDESPAEGWIDADGHRMVQVLENLLTNALRYVPPGGAVTLAMRRTAADGRNGLRLTVTDDGPGLSAAERAHLFERFYRAPGARGANGDEAAGSGLGLAIVREIVQRHGGRVGARAATPHGLAIDVELPARG